MSMKSITYKCPVCEGKRVVLCGFYSTGYSYSSTNTAPEKCKTCNGNGIVWSWEFESSPWNAPSEVTFWDPVYYNDHTPCLTLDMESAIGNVY